MAAEQAIVQPVAYHHITRDAYCITDDLTRQALEVRAIVAF